MDQLQKGAIGATIEIDVIEDNVALDLTTVVQKDLYFRKPNGTVVSVSADFVTTGSDGKVKYVTTAADFLDVPGVWKVQAYLAFSGGGYQGRGEVGEFRVLGNL